MKKFSQMFVYILKSNYYLTMIHDLKPNSLIICSFFPGERHLGLKHKKEESYKTGRHTNIGKPMTPE